MIAPSRGGVGSGTAPVFEDEFFRQLVGGTLNEQPVVEPQPVAAPTGPKVRTEPRSYLPVLRLPRLPALIDPRRVAALVMGAIVLVGVYALGRGGDSAGFEGSVERSQVVRPVVPPSMSGGGAARRTELIVRWSGTAHRGATAVARRRVGWIRGGRLAIAGTVRTPGGYGKSDGPITVIAADGDRAEAEAQVGELTPNEEGDFQAAVALDQGAARKLLTFAYGRDGERAPLATAKAVLEVEGGLTMTARRSGRSVLLSGRTRPGRATLRIAVRAPRSAWSEHSVVRSDSSGNWHARAHLPRPVAPGRYSFRVGMRGEADRGFLAVSRTRSVLVPR